MHEYVMNKQFIELTLTINVIKYYNAKNKQVMQLSKTFVSKCMHLSVYFYVLYYTFVLGTW